MEQVMTSVIGFLAQHEFILYGVAFFVGIIEALPVIGNFSPSSMMLVSFGVIASLGSINISILIFIVFVASILSDALGYYLGSQSTRFFKPDSKYLKSAHIERGQVFFAKHGGWSVFLGRFISPIRPIIAFTAGLCHMDKVRFWKFNITSGILWTCAYILPGYLAGFGLQDVHRIDRMLFWVGMGALAFYILSYGIYRIVGSNFSEENQAGKE